MGRRSEFKRRPHDGYQTTDERAVRALRPWLFGNDTFAEPCCGNGHLVRLLQDIDMTCVLASDILEGVDALQITDFAGADTIITNPPWTRQLLHPLLLHFQKHAPTWLLMDSDWAYNAGSARYLDTCSHIVAVGRLCWYPDTKQTGKDNVSWYRFWKRHCGGPHFYGRA